MSDEQREKEQERVQKKPRVAAQGLSVSFHIGLHERAGMCCNPGCFLAGKCMANCAAGRVCSVGSCIAKSALGNIG